ncbi:MAG: HAD family hydrolase [Rhizobiaceae bacterium]
MPQPDLIIFDCDGVLVDSEIVAARVEAELITAAGHPITAEEIAESYAGLTFRDILMRIEEAAEVPFQATMIDEVERLIDRRLMRELRPVDGARQAVLGVAVPYCICSNSTTARLKMELEKTRLLDLFPEDRIFSAQEIPSRRTKPAPDVFLHAASTLGVGPANAFVVEDSVHGVTGARAAGMRVIGFTGASHSHHRHSDMLAEAGAETVIRRWADFPGVVAALSEWSED